MYKCGLIRTQLELFNEYKIEQFTDVIELIINDKLVIDLNNVERLRYIHEGLVYLQYDGLKNFETDINCVKWTYLSGNNFNRYTQRKFNEIVQI